MKIKLTACAFAVTLIQGCASLAVSNDAIEANTAHTLGLSVSEFTVSDRQDSCRRTIKLDRKSPGFSIGDGQNDNKV